MPTVRLPIHTTDGEGEAVKRANSEAWSVTMPAKQFDFYGSVREVKQQILDRNPGINVAFHALEERPDPETDEEKMTGHPALSECNPLTPADALGQLQALYGPVEPDVAHNRADAILCELLTALGHGDVVAAWDAIDPKWYE